MSQKRRRKGRHIGVFRFLAAECSSVFSSICCAYAIAAEQKARAVYDNILRVSDDPDVSDVIKFLREREIVHFQRFGEALDKLQNKPMRNPICCGRDKK